MAWSAVSALFAQRERMRGHPVARPDVVHPVPDGRDEPGGLDTQRHRRLDPEVPASPAGDLIPVAHPGRPDVDQHLVRAQRPRRGQLQKLDRRPELGDPRCSHRYLRLIIVPRPSRRSLVAEQ